MNPEQVENEREKVIVSWKKRMLKSRKGELRWYIMENTRRLEHEGKPRRGGNLA